MTKEEAEKVVQIMLTADGSCIYCAHKLVSLFEKEFPEHKQLAWEVFKTKFNYKEDEG